MLPIEASLFNFDPEYCWSSLKDAIVQYFFETIMNFKDAERLQVALETSFNPCCEFFVIDRTPEA